MDDGIVDVARTIRPYLPQLARKAAPELDRELATLIEAAAAGEDVGQSIRTLLAHSRATYAWMLMVQADKEHRPPELQREESVRRSSKDAARLSRLGGKGEPVDAEKFVCLNDQIVYWRPSVGDPVLCPKCGRPLTRG